VIRSGHLGDTTFRIGTAHWADITYYRQGFINLIGALMMTAFGVRFFAEVAASADKNDNWLIRASSWFQRRVLKLMVQILALVVFPVTFVSLILSCIGLIGIYVFKTQLAGWQKEFIAIASFALCTAAALTGVRRSWEFRKERPLAIWIFLMIAGIGCIVSIAMLLGDRLWISTGAGKPFDIFWQPAHGQPPGAGYLQLPIYIRDTIVSIAMSFKYVELADRFRLVDETAAYFALMHALQLVAGIVLLALTLLAMLNLALLVSVSLVTGRIYRTYVFATVSVITIWIINLVLLWPENLATFAAMTQFMDDARLKETITVTGVNWSTWQIETLKIGLGDPVEFRPGFMNKRLYADTYPVMWFEAMFIVFLFATLLLVLSLPVARLTYRMWRRLRKTPLAAFAPHSNRHEPDNHSWPRLIISGAYVLFVLILIVVVPGALLVVVLNATGLGAQIPFVHWIARNLPNDLTVGAEWARSGVILFLILFLLFSHLIRDGARLILDVVNHFTPRRRSRGQNAGQAYFPVRQRIERRFEEMIEALLSRGDKPNLLIVAHSQGTIITLDALRRRGWMERLLPRVESLTVITFGSPVTHVYQRYFPQLYKPFDKTPSLVRLSEDKRVKWFNVYRVDDFVGTYIENSIPNFPVNIPAPHGGHTSYWQEDVMKELFNHPGMRDVLVKRT
jgi:pimeloyl-ACP methyl ester carboxylesterase